MSAALRADTLATMPPVRFSAATVLFRTDAGVLRRALASLAVALDAARAAGRVGEARVLVVVNDPEGPTPALQAVLR